MVLEKNGLNNFYHVKRTYEAKGNILQKKISNDSVLEMEDFLGYPISADVLENLDDRIREILDRMPEEEIVKYALKYGIR